MDTNQNINLASQTEDKSNYVASNYHQPQADGADQTVLLDPATTAETDELDPAFHQQDPAIDPEYEDDEDEDDFPAKEDMEDEDFELNRDDEDDLSLNIDEDDFN